MIEKVLKVFLLEDRPMEAELTKRALLKFAPNAMITVAKDEKEFLQRIHWSTYDVMLADYRLPDFNGLEALLYVREHFAHLPFVFVTGQLNDEEQATEAILKGANGYVLKQNLDHLEEAVTRALDEAWDRKKAADALTDSRQQRSLMLQKAVYLVEESREFPQKKEILNALKQVSNLT